VIGLTTYSEPAQMAFWHDHFAMIHRTYIDALTAAGAIVVMLPPQASDPETARALVERLDGLVLAGGADIDPRIYGEEPEAGTGSPRVDRDLWELALLRASIEHDLPMLCICRGMQLLNAALGGSLYQHVPDVTGHPGHQPELGTFGATTIHTKPGTLTHALFGEEQVVACHHHQSVRTLAPTLRASAHSRDSIIEAAEHTDHRFLLAVQWHPEQSGAQAPLFEALVSAARGASIPREVSSHGHA
jgi:putative glutamine amidotransferase